MRSKIETANQPDGGLKMEENWLSRRIMGQKRRVITGISTFLCVSCVCVMLLWFISSLIWNAPEQFLLSGDGQHASSCWIVSKKIIPRCKTFSFKFFLKKMSAEFRINRLIIPAIMICRCENVWRRHLMGAIVDLKKKFQIPSTDLVEAVINLSHLVPLFLGAAQSDQQIAQKNRRTANQSIGSSFSASRGSSNSRHDKHHADWDHQTRPLFICLHLASQVAHLNKSTWRCKFHWIIILRLFFFHQSSI